MNDNQSAAMPSLVQQLQAEALNPEISVADLLRKAKVIAAKLELQQFHSWIDNELGGYTIDNQEELPKYRIVRGEVRAFNPYRGWLPIFFSTPGMEERLSRRGINQSIAALQDMMTLPTEGDLVVDFSSEAKGAIGDAIGFRTDVKLFIGRNAVAGILDAVRTLILDWSLRLEKEGILGEGLSFSLREKEKAQTPGTYYHVSHIENFAGAIGPISGQSELTVNQVNAAAKDKAAELIEQVKKYAPLLDLHPDQQRRLNVELGRLDEELKSDQANPSRVRKALASVKAILEGAAGNVVAQGIIAAIQNLSF